MSKKAFWGIIVGVIVFATLAATRSMWMNIDDLGFLKTYIPKVNIKPKERSEAYEQACASCHMLYAPGILPARSWEKMMAGLTNHFGDNAEMLPENRRVVSEYLQRNATDVVENIYSEFLMKSIGDSATPLRITEVGYFKLIHDVVRPEMVQGNPDVKSIARCDVCHREAVDGRFNRFDTRIPNYYHEGVWKKIPSPQP